MTDSIPSSEERAHALWRVYSYIISLNEKESAESEDPATNQTSPSAEEYTTPKGSG